MKKVSDYRNTRVVSVEEGAVVGRLRRLVLDIETRTVAGALLDDGRHAVDGEDIVAVGDDALMVRSTACLIDLESRPELAELIRSEESLYQKEVFTITGRKIGYVVDVLIDPASRRIVGLEMFSEHIFSSSGEVRGVVLLDEKVIVGRDLVIVPEDVRSIDLEEEIRSSETEVGLDGAAGGETGPAEGGRVEGALEELSSVFPGPAGGGGASDDAGAALGGDEDVSGDSSVEIDFEGVVPPRPEVLHEPPEQQAGESSSAPPRDEPGPEDGSGREMDEKTRKVVEFVRGKVSSRDVKDSDGEIVLRKGERITDEIIGVALEKQLLAQLFLAASQGLHQRLRMLRGAGDKEESR